jgi:hypothetical protein
VRGPRDTSPGIPNDLFVPCQFWAEIKAALAGLTAPEPTLSAGDAGSRRAATGAP